MDSIKSFHLKKLTLIDAHHQKMSSKRSLNTFICILTLHLISPINTLSERQAGIKIKTINQFDDVTVLHQHTALIGSRVDLICDVATPSDEDAITLIFWYKNDRKNPPIYSVDGRSVPIDKAPHFILSEDFKNRVKFDLSIRPAILTIDSINENDGGLYLCRVDFKWARTTNSLNNLTIIDSPKVELILTSSKKEISRDANPGPQNFSISTIFNTNDSASSPSSFSELIEYLISEDSEINLECKIRSNPPIINVKWFKNKLPFDISKDLLTNFTIKSASWNDSGTYSCTAFNSAGKGESKPLKINVLYTPKVTINLLSNGNGRWKSSQDEHLHRHSNDFDDDIPELGTSIDSSGDTNDYHEIKEGEEIVLMCEIQSNPPWTMIQWLKDDRLIKPHPVTAIIGNRTLSIKSADYNTTGSYKCLAANSQGKGESRSIRISILYLPKVELDLITNRETKWSSNSKTEPETEFSAGHYSPKEGDEIILHCKVKSNPPVNKVNWYKNDILLHSNSTKELKLAKIGHQDSGAYRCLAENSLGIGKSKSIHLTVLFAPICDIHRNSHLREQSSRITSSSRSVPQSSLASKKSSSSPVYFTYILSPGEHVNLTCTVDANPRDVSFHWALNGSEILGQSTDTTITSASTSHGQSSPSRPQIRMNTKLNGLIVKDITPTTTIDHSSDSSPSKSSSANSDHHHSENLNDHHQHSHHGQSSASLQSILQLTPKSIMDFGLLACWAENAIGSQSEPCLFAILPTSLAPSLESCSINNQTWESLVVECIPKLSEANAEQLRDLEYSQQLHSDKSRDSMYNNFHQDSSSPPSSSILINSSPVVYHLEVYHQQSDNSPTNLLRNLSNSSPVFLVSGLSPGSTYTMSAYSANARGKSSALMLKSETLTMLTRKQDPVQQSGDLLDSRILLFVLSFTCLFLLSALIILIVLKIRKRDELRSGRKASIDKNGTKVADRSQCEKLVTKAEILLGPSIDSDTSKSECSSIGLIQQQHQHHHQAHFLSHPEQSVSPQRYRVTGQAHHPNYLTLGQQPKWIITSKIINPDVIPQDMANCSTISKDDLFNPIEISMAIGTPMSCMEISPIKMFHKAPPHVTLVESQSRSPMMITPQNNIYPEDAFEDQAIISHSTAV
ncbi:uncharacterized protein LOC141853316 [Brevipalpus obovatus]|uniref:uncharacterized protein LOC141853316 n=1 Tax=Brevipalpus obovatus TaxID=246614 RepID=UPI003D9E85B1